MLAESLLAAVLVLAPAAVDEPGRVPPVRDGAPAPAVATETALSVTPLGGREMRLDIRVIGADGSVPEGRVLVRSGDAAVADLPLAHGRASLTTSAVADGGSLSATFRGGGGHLASDSVPPPAAGAVRSEGTGVVAVSIPAGALTISLAPDRPDTLRVTDTRAGERGFTVSAAVIPAGPPRTRMLPVAVRPVQVPGYALQADDARTPSPILLLSRRPITVLSYPAHLALGALDVEWRALSPARGDEAMVVWTVL